MLQEIKVRKLEEEVHILESQAMAKPTTRARPREELIPDNTSGQSKRQWQEESDDDLLPRHTGGGRDIKTVKPDHYDGKLLHSFKEYVWRCKLMFCLRPD